METYRDEHQGNTSTQLEHPLPNEMQRLIVNQLNKDSNEKVRDMTNMVRMESGWIIEPDRTENFTSFQAVPGYATDVRDQAPNRRG